MENNFEKNDNQACRDNHQQHNHEHGHEHTHNSLLIEELMCHLPYAMLSVALGITVLSFLGYGALLACIAQGPIRKGSWILFHSFHFMHIAFAATGTLVTYLRFSKNIFWGLVVSILTPSIFCTLSDVVFPHLAGKLLGVHMHWHLCFWGELHNILPFLFAGLVNGFVMSRHHSSKQTLFSVFSHFFHILISSFAAIFYLVSQGCTNWYDNIGIVFLLLVIAVVVPCTISDVVVPMMFTRAGKKDKDAKH